MAVMVVVTTSEAGTHGQKFNLWQLHTLPTPTRRRQWGMRSHDDSRDIERNGSLNHGLARDRPGHTLASHGPVTSRVSRDDPDSS